MLHFDFCHVFSLPVTYMKFPVCGDHPCSFPPVDGLKSPEWCEGPRREVKQEAAQMAPILGQLGHGVRQVNPRLWLFLDHGVLQTLMSTMQKRLSKEKIQSQFISDALSPESVGEEPQKLSNSQALICRDHSVKLKIMRSGAWIQSPSSGAYSVPQHLLCKVGLFYLLEVCYED